jgi:membrane associated rhomboid family serine protease
MLTAPHRTITALAVVVSALGYGNIISLYQYIFDSRMVLTTKIVPQIWRVFTAFLITKPKFAILLDPYFLYQYGSAIERESSRFAQPGDFFVYTMFVGSVIVVSICLLARVCSALCTFVDLLATEASPRIICPPSLSQWLKWFLEPRKSTLAHHTVRHSQNIKGLLGCVGMVG